MREDVRDGAVAGLLAGAVSGLPSTLHALATGGDLRASTIAAGSIALPRTKDERVLLAAGVPVHLAVSAFWGIALAHAFPRARPSTSLFLGGFGGLGIAALDLGLVGRLFPRIRALPRVPQLADHVAYGAVAALVLERLRRVR